MTEIVAALLERVARELSERVVKALFNHGYLSGPTIDRLDAEDIAGDALKAGLAAALAACAREEARFWQPFVPDAPLTAPERKMIEEHWAALERAAGEKT